MLSLLHIENIAVIERADISFDAGFNVLTGETGAGKSIVIDAISAIMGQRAYRDMIRTGTNKASVRGVFTQVPELPWFQENGVEYDAETVIQRDVFLDGKNVCRVNGSLVSVSILHKLGLQLINIHGQHDSASLFDEENHLRFLDAFADNGELLRDYREKFGSVSRLRREIDRMSMDESEKLRRMETLRYQIAEIEKADLQPGEDEELESRRKLLQNSEKLSQGLEDAVEALLGGDDTNGAVALLAEAEYALSRIARYSDNFSSLQERLTDLKYQVQDLADEVRDARDDLSYSADELEQIAQLMNRKSAADRDGFVGAVREITKALQMQFAAARATAARPKVSSVADFASRYREKSSLDAADRNLSRVLRYFRAAIEDDNKGAARRYYEMTAKRERDDREEER